MDFASFSPCKSLKPNASLSLYWKQIIFKIFSFCTYYKIENKHKNDTKIKFWTEELSEISIILYSIFSFILIVVSDTVQDKYSFTANKNLDPAPFPSYKILKRYYVIALYWKRIILQIFSFPLISALKMRIKLQWNKTLNWWFLNK